MSDQNFLSGIVAGMVTRGRAIQNLEQAEPVAMPPPPPRPLPPVASKARQPSELHRQLEELNLLPPEPFPLLRTEKSKAVGVRRGARFAGQQGMSPQLKQHELVPLAEPVPPRVRLGPGEVDVRGRQKQRNNKMDTVKINLGRKANWRDPPGITVPIPGTPLAPSAMFKVNVRSNPAAPNIRSTADLLQTPRVSLDRLNISREMVQKNVGQPQNDSLDEANFNWDSFTKDTGVHSPGLRKRQKEQKGSGIQLRNIADEFRERERRATQGQPPNIRQTSSRPPPSSTVTSGALQRETDQEQNQHSTNTSLNR
jgi:hypothetical protein